MCSQARLTSRAIFTYRVSFWSSCQWRLVFTSLVAMCARAARSLTRAHSSVREAQRLSQSSSREPPTIQYQSLARYRNHACLGTLAIRPMSPTNGERAAPPTVRSDTSALQRAPLHPCVQAVHLAPLRAPLAGVHASAAHEVTSARKGCPIWPLTSAHQADTSPTQARPLARSAMHGFTNIARWKA